MILLKWCFPKQGSGFRFEVVLCILLRLIQHGKEGILCSDFLPPCPVPSSGWHTWLGHTGTLRVVRTPQESITMRGTALLKHRNPRQSRPGQAQHALKHRGAVSFGKREGRGTESLLQPPVPAASSGLAPGTQASLPGLL